MQYKECIAYSAKQSKVDSAKKRRQCKAREGRCTVTLQVFNRPLTLALPCLALLEVSKDCYEEEENLAWLGYKEEDGGMTADP